MVVELIPIDGGTPITLAKEMSLVGRADDCDIQLNHKSVSKQHCVIVKTDNVVVVRDLGSTNGTRVNGQKVRRGILLPNDGISIANFHFRLVFRSEHNGHSNGEFLGQTMHTQGNGQLDEELEALLSVQPAVRRNDLPDNYS
jgi:pSer/pThr/pTyr-binding forkhead associated (FHA) protein